MNAGSASANQVAVRLVRELSREGISDTALREAVGGCEERIAWVIENIGQLGEMRAVERLAADIEDGLGHMGQPARIDAKNCYRAIISVLN